MQKQKKKTSETFYYLSHVSTTMEKNVGLLMQTPKDLNGKRKKQVNRVSTSIKSFLFLIHYHCGHPTRQCSMQNQVHLSAVDNDNIRQLANVVN